MGWKTYWQDDRVKAMRNEARAKLDRAKSLLGKGCTDSEIALANKLQGEASQIIDDAERLIEIAQLADEQGVGKVKEVKKMESKDRGGFDRGFGSFLKAVAETKQGHRDERLVKGTKALAEGAGVTGGYMVPQGFLAEVFEVEGFNAVIEPRARVIEMNGRSLNMPALDQTGTAVDKPHFLGSLDMRWTEESAAKPEAEPAFKQIELVPHKIAGYCEVSDELFEDSNPSINSYLSGLFGEALAWFKDRAYIQGDGVGKPLGIIGAAGRFTQVRAVAANFGYVDAVNMLTHFRGKNAVWLMHQSVMPELYTMQDPGNNYVYVTNAPGRAPQNLLGYPVIFTEHNETLGTTGDVLLCDLSKYLIGKRKGITVETSGHVKFREDVTAFRFFARTDGQEGNQSTIMLADGATQVSPFVELDAATS